MAFTFKRAKINLITERKIEVEKLIQNFIFCKKPSNTHRAVLDDNALVLDQECFQRANDSSQVALVFVVVVQVLSVQNVVQRHNVIILSSNTRSDASQFLKRTGDEQMR